MLKGHTKIELTNVNTGEVKVVEDDNIVTNAMAKMFDLMPYCQYNVGTSNPFNSSLPFIDRLCGGILLFKDPIEENPDNWKTPKGNRMTGNGRINYASGNDVPEFGSFNAEESSYDSKTGERKYVYDFGTSKANGTISCVALTNFLTGYFGLGNPSGKRESITIEKVNYGSSNLLFDYFWGYYYDFPSSFSYPDGMTRLTSHKILFADYNENCIYAFDHYAFKYDSSYATSHMKYGNLKVSKIDFPFHSFNPMFRDLGSERFYRITKQIEIPVPSEISSLSTSYTGYYNVCRADDAIYIIFPNTSGYVEANKNFYVWKIGYDLETSEVLTLKNTTGTYIYVSHDSGRSTSYIEDGYLICPADDLKRMFKIKLSDPTDVTELENLTGYTKNAEFAHFAKIGDTLIVKTHSGNHTAVVNLTENKVYPINGSFGIDSYDSHLIPIRGKDNFLIKSSSGFFSGTNAKIVYNSSFLSTINNLPEPVVKTSDLSMKITYTLTPLGDEEEGDS